MTPLRITAELEYAVRALVALAVDGPQTAPQLAVRHGLSRPFLQQVLQRLRIGGLVTARRGSTGGYRLRCPADETNLSAVVRAVRGEEGDLAPCLPPWAAVDRFWSRLDEEVADRLERTTIADLAGPPP